MVLTDKLNRSVTLAAAALLFTASLVPLLSQTASAYGLLTERKITMSSSAPSATDVNYLTSFEAATSASVGGVVVDFCNSPIIGDTCNTPAGFDSNEAGLAFSQTGLAGFTLNAASDTNTLIFTNGTPQALTTGTTYTITLGAGGGADGITNPQGDNTANPPNSGVAPEDNVTFYARILTYDNAANAAAYSSVAAGGGTGVVDAGGVALSTANQLTITAKVQERLTFCVYTTGTACANGVGSNITLGDTNGVLDSGVEYTNNTAKFSVSTNANGLGSDSVTIRAKGGTLKSGACADGSGQACSINPIGGTATDTAAGTEQFGFCLNAAGQTPLAASVPYDGATFCDVSGTGNTATNRYAFDDNNTTGTQSPYGQGIAVFNAATEKTGTLDFVGNIGATTEPGIYTTTLSFIATGTY